MKQLITLGFRKRNIVSSEWVKELDPRAVNFITENTGKDENNVKFSREV